MSGPDERGERDRQVRGVGCGGRGSVGRGGDGRAGHLLTRGREPFDDAQTTDVVAPAQVVRSWCRRGTEPDGVRLQPEADMIQSASGGDRFRPFTGESTKQAGSPLRAERRMRPVLSWRLTRVLSLLHTRLRTHRASGVPRALSTRGRDVHRTPRAQLRRENAKSCLQSLPLFDIRIRELTHGLAASPASSPRRRGPIRRVVYGV